MKKTTMAGIVLILVVMCLVPSGVLAAPPAKDNFGNLVVVDGTGAVLGTFLSYQHMPPSLFDPLNYSELMYMNSNGYVISLEDQNPSVMVIHKISNVYYESIDCTGPAHVQLYRLIGTVWTYDDKDNPGGILVGYVPMGAVLHTIYLGSLAINGLCYTASGEAYIIDLLPNDPSVTGVSDPLILKPISIQRRNR